MLETSAITDLTSVLSSILNFYELHYVDVFFSCLCELHVELISLSRIREVIEPTLLVFYCKLFPMLVILLPVLLVFIFVNY